MGKPEAASQEAADELTGGSTAPERTRQQMDDSHVKDPARALDEDDSDQFQTVDTPSARSASASALAGIVGSGSIDGIPSNRSGPVRPVPISQPAMPSNGANSGPSDPGSFPVAKWDRYDFLSLLGQGGMGAVYKARDRRLRRLVALKFIRGGDERLTQRFMQEARAQSRIDHPGICKVLEVGEVEGKAYIAMQFVDGKSLQQAKSELSMLDKVSVVKAAAEALHAAHELGIIHRDIKPANIMIERHADGKYYPVIMDFGLARDTTENTGMTESGTVMGTAAFMSPEQARGHAKSLDRRTDVYSLGATLFDLLAGRPPFLAESMADTLMRVMLDDAPPLRSLAPNVPEALEIIVGKSLNKEPAQRYATAQDFAEDLHRFLEKRRIIGKRLSLYYRLRYKAQRNKPAAVILTILLLTLVAMIGYGIRLRIQAAQRERQARQQAELAQRLGQEIKDMEWMLRSARQLPLHNLDREKKIMRQRIEQLQLDLTGYGELARGLAHYALGRAHTALHEYPAALEQLRLSIAVGNERPEVLYSLGYVLGKHYEQAMADARLAGGGDFAKKQLKQIEPTYLLPAIDALQRSRAVKLDAAAYLDGLIAYYQGDYESAIRRANEALLAAPWLYEAHKLIGDVQLQRGLRAVDRAQFPEAEVHLAAAVSSFEQAAHIGQSDAEVYEALADAWIQRMAVAQQQQQRPAVQAGYAAVLAISDKIRTTEPGSIMGPLKHAQALAWRITAEDPNDDIPDLATQCQVQAKRVLAMQAQHPYASNLLSTCIALMGTLAFAKRQEAEPWFHKSIAALEPILEKTPYFLDGFRNLAMHYRDLARHAQRRGGNDQRLFLTKSLENFGRALALDPNDASAMTFAFDVRTKLMPLATSLKEIDELLLQAEKDTQRCHELIGEHPACEINRLTSYAAAVERSFAAGRDPQPLLKKADDILSQLRKQDVKDPELEQAAMLVRYVEAAQRLSSQQDPSPALALLQDALRRCIALQADNPICLDRGARAAWLDGEWRADRPKQASKTLKSALATATQAAENAPKFPEGLQAVAESHLRLALLEKPRSKAADSQLAEAAAALEKALAMNPDLATARVTEGKLLLAQAAAVRDEAKKAALARQAQAALERALLRDPLLRREAQAHLSKAQELAAR
ncbi:MAG: serine/threonine protein kinase [Myxococcales bacterium]|nr:serine/threonine protein kinase [Myxococcales bacterium]